MAGAGRVAGCVAAWTSATATVRFRLVRVSSQIMLAVRWYLRYGLSYRDVEELRTERGVTVDHVTVYRWV